MSNSLTNLLSQLRHVSIVERCRMSPGWMRGLILSRKFNKHGSVHAGSGIRIRKKFAIIELGEGVNFGHQVGIGAHGVDETSPACLRIGAHTIIGARSHINCRTSVSIGSHCAISWDVEILDSDMHSIIAEDGSPLANQAPVSIEDRVWIGTRAMILKGASIGHDSIVAAGAIVTGSIPPFSICAGNPAKVIRQIRGWKH